jgi:hypothetical protein
MRVTAISAGIAATAWLTTATVHADQHSHVMPSQAHGSQAHGGQAPKTTGSSKHTPSTTTSTTSTTTTTSSGNTGSGTAGNTSTTTTAPISPLAQKIATHPKLAAKLQTLLPAGPDGKQMSLNAAALGYSNQGQFIAALHVSQNLGIPFESLKALMVDKHMSLGQAIQNAKPGVNSTAEAERGETEAENDVKTTTGTTTGTTTSSKTGKPGSKTGSHK